MSRKVVITCALTGSFDTRSKNPAVPVTPEEIANSALEAAKAGAAVVHVHVRDPKTTLASMEFDLYRETVERIREKNGDVLINLTTGPGGRFVPGKEDPAIPGPGTSLRTPAVRLRHVEQIKPPICTLDVATLNFGEHVFLNTPAHLREMADRAKAAGAKPEVEVFDLGHIELAKRLIADGHIAEPPLFQICLGIPWGAPATPETMIQMRDRLPRNAIWSGFGISKMQFPMVALAATLGGNVRVGLEDNLYLARGVKATNGQLVERARTIVEAMNVRVLGPDEVRERLALVRHG
jgi:uncharacterized protein (DUF849 family)